MKHFFALLGILLLLSACSQQTTEEDTPTSCPPDCAGGSTGVVTTINAPSDGGSVYVGDRLVASATLDDLGESSVEDGVVCITGLDGETFSGLGGCNCENFYITLDDPHDSNFEQTMVNFDSALVPSDASGNQHLTFYTRYRYTAYGPMTLCLTGDPYQETECAVEGDKLTSSSSGPVQIASVEEILSTEGSNAINVRLKITANAPTQATGQLVDLDYTSEPSCVLPTDITITGKVYVILFGEAQDCGTITFEQGEDTATTTCKLDSLTTDRFIGGQKEYDGWVRIDYGYQEIQSVAFTIVSE